MGARAVSWGMTQHLSLSELSQSAEADVRGAEIGMIRLSREASERLAAAMIDPPALAPAMERAFEHHRRLVTSE